MHWVVSIAYARSIITVIGSRNNMAIAIVQTRLVAVAISKEAKKQIETTRAIPELLFSSMRATLK